MSPLALLLPTWPKRSLQQPRKARRKLGSWRSGWNLKPQRRRCGMQVLTPIPPPWVWFDVAPWQMRILLQSTSRSEATLLYEAEHDDESRGRGTKAKAYVQKGMDSLSFARSHCSSTPTTPLQLNRKWSRYMMSLVTTNAGAEVLLLSR